MADYTYDGDELDRIRIDSVETTQSADHGSPAGGNFTYDDTPGTQEIVGQKDFEINEDDCAFPLTFRGFIGERSYSRQKESTGAAREITVALEDLNTMLGHRLIYRHAGMTIREAGNRLAETVAERAAWLMASPFVAFADNGRCDFPSTVGMDAANYQHQHPGEVLADMALACGRFNYHVNDWGAGPELTFRDDDASTDDTSTLRISNVLSDESSVTLYPKRSAVLRRDPSNVISVLSYSYAKSPTVVEERAATAAAFNGERSGTASNSHIKTAAKARDEAQSQLFQLSAENDVIECGIDAIPSSQINLVLPGMRIQAKFSHLAPEGYDDFTWFRVLERTVRPLVAEGGLYELDLKLSPQEEGPPAGAGILQSAFGASADGVTVLHLPNPVTIGSLLVYFVGDRDGENPTFPNVEPDRERWGSGAWTKKPNVTAGQRTDGVAIWYKTADSTAQDGYVGESTAAVYGIYEIAGGDIASATTVSKDEQASTATMDIGSLGSPVAGSVNLMIGLWFDEKHWDDATTPGYTPRTGWTLDIFSPAYYAPLITWNAPLMYIAHNIGTGAALTAGGTRSGLLHLDGKWGGAAISIPPL